MFFRAAVDCALNRTELCIREVSNVIDASKGGNEEYEAHSILAGAYLRQGEYRLAQAQTQAMLKLRPNEPDTQSSLAFMKAASAFPDQRLVSGTPTRVPWVHPGKSLTIPLTINGKQAGYFIDTGANVSTISDGDALRLGLEVSEANFRVGGSTGQAANFKIASARHLKIGNFELENVAFLVSPANQPPFNDMPSMEQGIIGIPVLLAARHIRWNRTAFEIIGETNHASQKPAKLVLDQGNVIAEASFQGRALSLFIDSGSMWSEMYPRFTNVYGNYLKARGTKTSKKLEGFGGRLIRQSGTYRASRSGSAA